METKPVVSIETEKKTYVEPTLEKRDQLIEVVEMAAPVSGVMFL